ncbi:membrane protease YdiL (CAAX protease family) [Lysinibacillus composti]|uniref:CPBP family intramembrane metalloprotease n=1 Tax=Lysinibacillus composti TaxID=720633 RepID=A0A3N9UTX3_9BACI|nr:type II CAAX endopeptidase family protein [Lysinibacillus composti]MBM7607878.1 membrane protease YdiL (CAAX protease family) [Lysinibacillus composti]RQW75346.1 CPBP family intramembrane metalloprotease [Lysinibacillus composti]
MKSSKHIVRLLLPIVFFYVMLFFAFEEDKIFWYLYTFTILVGVSITILYETIKDELPTWKYLIFGIGYGTITYGIIRLGYIILNSVNDDISKSVAKFLASYGPLNIWHYLLLIIIIVVGEELFWRGFVQQQLKRILSPMLAILVTSVLFALSIAISGFIPGVIAALVVGLILGMLYEWKKSMPLIIVTHEVFILLLFLILPFS